MHHTSTNQNPNRSAAEKLKALENLIKENEDVGLAMPFDPDPMGKSLEATSGIRNIPISPGMTVRGIKP